MASLADMSDQCMFTSFLQQTALLVTNNRDHEQTRLTTRQPDNPQDHCFFDTAKREQTSNASTHNTASMIVPRNQSHRDSQTDLTRRDRSVIHPPLMPAEARNGNTSPSPSNSSNNARQQQLKLARSSPLHAAHIQKPRHTPRLQRGIHSFDIRLETTGTHICEAALINQKLPLVHRQHNTQTR